MRTLAALLAAGAVALLAAAPAQAHPLGNFSVNHLGVVSISRDHVDVRYVLDQAEIPTFQQRDRADGDVLAATRREVARELTLRVDGRPVALRLTGAGRITHARGQGGLPTTRVELSLRAPARDARRVILRDATFDGRVGWKAIIVARGAGTAVRSSVPARDPTGGLRRYPSALLSSPADTRSATFALAPGAGTVTAPGPDAAPDDTARGGAGDALSSAFERAAAGRGVLAVLLLTAFAWGMVHALSPGHGKAMVAAYLVGARGRRRDALALGLTVTVTHTVGVFALGLVTLALSQAILPEDLYPWLNLASGLLVVGVGVAVLRARVRRAHAHHHDHHHGHHHHHEPVTRRGLLALGASAGLIPCPSALVVLLAAIAQHEIALGLALIVAFSAGLAATLVALGLLVVSAAGAARRIRAPGRAAALVSAGSALAIVAVGVVLTAQAVPQL